MKKTKIGGWGAAAAAWREEQRKEACQTWGKGEREGLRKRRSKDKGQQLQPEGEGNDRRRVEPGWELEGLRKGGSKDRGQTAGGEVQ